MPLLLSQLASDGPLVLIAAAPLEIRAILDGARRAGFTGEDPGRSIEAEGVADWRPVRLDPDGHGNWRVHLPVEPGLHRINVRYDGGAWRVPPGTRAVPDEFGVLTGEIVVG